MTELLDRAKEAAKLFIQSLAPSISDFKKDSHSISDWMVNLLILWLTIELVHHLAAEGVFQ